MGTEGKVQIPALSLTVSKESNYKDPSSIQQEYWKTNEENKLKNKQLRPAL